MVNEVSRALRHGLRFLRTGSASDLVIAAPLEDGDADDAAHTDAGRVGLFFDVTPSAKRIGHVVDGELALDLLKDGAVFNGHVRPGDSSDTTVGNVRLNGGDVQGYVANVWASLTGLTTPFTNLSSDTVLTEPIGHYHADTSGGDVTITLPEITSGMEGRTLVFSKSGDGILYVEPDSGGDTIDEMLTPEPVDGDQDVFAIRANVSEGNWIIIFDPRFKGTRASVGTARRIRIRIGHRFAVIGDFEVDGEVVVDGVWIFTPATRPIGNEIIDLANRTNELRNFVEGLTD